ncbi:MAG: SDR family oxidoreductase [Alphaproteobacteria bacterium]|nr:SDR family oxidoreductase [Alphaproteobacteria bacterium]
MPTVLITGAGRGIGREFARQYEAGGWRVVATCRDPSKYDLEGEVYPLDVTDPASIAALRGELNGEGIDLLVNNAGIYGPRGAALGAIDYGAWEDVLRTNVLGPVRVAGAFADLVGRSDLKKMVFISSRMGSIGENTSGGGYIYRSSKTALNMAVASLSVDLSGRGIICLLFHPGWVKTDMGGASAPIDAAASVAGMRAVIDRATLADSGRFLNYDGNELPW